MNSSLCTSLMFTCTTLTQTLISTSLIRLLFGKHFTRLLPNLNHLTRLRRSHYIARARQYRPTVPADVSNYVVDSYVRLRKRSKDDDAQAKSHTYTSARTLLGVLRLSQALARLRFSETVQRADVDEALRLMDVSKKSLADEDEDAHEHDRSDVSKIFRLIKDMAKQAQSGKKGRRTRGSKRFGRGPGGERDMDVDEDEDEEDVEELSMVDIRSRVLTSGFTEAQLMETILEVCRVLQLF